MNSEEKIVREFNQIVPGLFLTSAAGITKQNIVKNKIKCIINATKDCQNPQFAGVATVRISINDSEDENIQQYFQSVSTRIAEENEKGKNVVVHCRVGCSRSSTLVIAHLMKCNKSTLREAYDLVLKKRPIIHPNIGFFKQLIEYEKQLRGSNSVQMVESSHLDGSKGEIPDVYID